MKRGRYPIALCFNIDKTCQYIVDGSNWIQVAIDMTLEQAKKFYETLILPIIKKTSLAQRQWKVKSDSVDKIYTVRFWANGSYSCECEGFKFRNNCKHIEKCKIL